ncbi:MAG: efflux RND transporter periplasmic adaptor subunit [Myxococcota bacterium]
MRRGETKGSAERRRVLRKWAGRGLLALLALALVGGIVAAWMPKPVPVDVVRAERGPMRVAVEEDGRTRVKNRHVISAPLSGNLGRIEHKPGDRVEADDVLARIVPLAAPLLDERSRAQTEARLAAAEASRRQAEATIERAAAALEYAEREAARQRRLVEQGSAPPQALERAELELRSRREELTSARFGAKVARSEARMARAALGRIRGDGPGEDEQMEVTSPVTGAVLRVQQESEGVVQTGTPLLEVGDPSALEVVVDVLTSDAVHVEPGARTIIDRWGGDRSLDAHVRRVEPSAFTRVSALGVEEQRVNVIIDLDEPHDVWAALGDGYRVEASIVVWEADEVLRVPASAVFRRGNGWALFAERNGTAELRRVRIGQRNGEAAQILEGLEPGERVVLHPSDQVDDGVAVQVREGRPRAR